MCCLNEQSTFLTTYAPFVDFAKISNLSPHLYPEAFLREKLALYIAYDVTPLFGGILFENAVAQGKANQLVAYLRDLSAPAIEISNNILDLSTKEMVRHVQNYSETGITMIIMSSEGGGMDRTSRYLDASGQIALRSYFAVKDDGYTVFSGNIPTLTLGYGAKKQDYVLEDELAWLCAYLDDPAILATTAGSDYQNVSDLISAAKQSPIRVGVAGGSSVQTLAFLKLAQDTGAQFEIIPLSRFPKAATAMLAQDIEKAVATSRQWNALVKKQEVWVFRPQFPNRHLHTIGRSTECAHFRGLIKPGA